MRIMGSMIVALLLESSLIGCEIFSHHQPITMSANVAMGKTDTPALSGDPKAGYVGMILNDNHIKFVFPGSPADKAGLAAGDKIMGIDDKTVFGLNGMGLADKLVGHVGAEIDLVVEHGDLLRRVSVLRALPVPEELVLITAQTANFKTPAIAVVR